MNFKFTLLSLLILSNFLTVNVSDRVITSFEITESGLGVKKDPSKLLDDNDKLLGGGTIPGPSTRVAQLVVSSNFIQIFSQSKNIIIYSSTYFSVFPNAPPYLA